MKYRPQRGGLSQSMREAVTLTPSRAALAEYLETSPDKITCEPYGGFDKRIQWDTHIICVDGCAVGFTDGPFSQ